MWAYGHPGFGAYGRSLVRLSQEPVCQVSRILFQVAYRWFGGTDGRKRVDFDAPVFHQTDVENMDGMMEPCS